PDGTDLNVNATFNLSAWILPVGQAGVLRFTAGNNLIFGATSTTSIRNGSFNGTGAVSRWDYEGRAGNDIVLNGAELRTGLGGNIFLSAGHDLKLLVGQGNQPNLTTTTGGNITLIAGGDLVASSIRLQGDSGPYTGIRLQGPGDLTIDVGGDFKGGSIVNGRLAGPGFVLSDGKARVTVGGNIWSPDS